MNKNPKEEIIECLKDDGINTIEEAQRFIEEKEDGLLTECSKWRIWFKDDEEPFEFSDDEDLINWCREQRDTYFNEE